MEKQILNIPQRSNAQECLVEFITPKGDTARVSATIGEGGIVRTNISVPPGWRMSGVLGQGGEVLPTKIIKRQMVPNKRVQGFQAPMKTINRGEKI